MLQLYQLICGDSMNKQKIFNIISLIIIITSFIVYMIRFIYFYKLEHTNYVESNLLVDKVKENSKDNLYNNYLKGNVENNYVYYSNQYFRILKIEDKKIVLVTDDIISSLIYGNSNYKQSYIYNYLNDYYSNLNTDYLTKTTLCLSERKSLDDNCEELVEEDIGLLSYFDYKMAGANKSYLNIGKHFWTLTKSKDNKVWYVFDEGGISDTNFENKAYGIRPVITLKEDTLYRSGNGTKDDPYIIENEFKIGVGSYIKYSNKLFRIIAVLDDGYIISSVDSIKNIFSYTTNKFKKFDYNSAYYYLNNVYYYELDSSLILENNWYIGEYISDYKEIYNEYVSAKVGMVNVSDLFSSDTLTLTPSHEMIIYKTEEGSLKKYDTNELLNIKPTIKISKDFNTSGSGTIDDPYEVLK